MLRLNSPFLHKMSLLLLIVAMLSGCAGQKMHREGLELLDEGRVEEGLAKLAEASKEEPENLTFRASLARNREQTVNRMMANASSERAAGHINAARAIYQRILGFDKDNSRARAGLDTLAMDMRHDALMTEANAWVKKGDMDRAQAALRQVSLENPKHGQAMLLQRQIDEQMTKDALLNPSLKGKFKKPVSLQFRDANLKMVFEALSRTSGINVLLDKDVKPDLKTSIFVKDVSVEDTIDLILLQNQLEKKVISDNTVFIYPNTPAKLKEYQDLKIRSFHLTNADPKQILTMIKTLLKTKDIFIHEKTNSIVMRDTPDAIRLAEKMVADQDTPDPEVMLEVEVIEIGRTRLSELGVKFPNQFTFTGLKGGEGAAGPTIAQLRDFYWQDFAVSPVFAATLNLKLEDGDTNVLASPRIRARNREKAKVMIGERVPVITNAVTPVATGAPVVTGNVQYLDVGLKLEVEPDIHPDNDVAIKINLEVSSILGEVPNAQSGTLAYRIGTRNASTVLRLKDGETQILAGLISDEDRNTASKVPGVGQMPFLGRLFSSNKGDIRKTEVILSITPRVVSNVRLQDARELEYWAGTESSLRTSALSMRPLGTVAVTSSGGQQAQQAGRGRPAAASVPVAASVAASAASAASDQPLVLSWQGPNQAKVGGKISLTLNTQAPQGVNSLGFLVNYDPSVLKASDVVEGGFLKQANPQSNFTKNIDQAGGQILVDLSGAGGGGATGSGSVVTVLFEVIGAAQQSNIAVSRITLEGENGKSLAFVAPEPYSITAVQ